MSSTTEEFYLQKSASCMCQDTKAVIDYQGLDRLDHLYRTPWGVLKNTWAVGQLNPTAMPHVFAGDIKGNDVMCVMVPVMSGCAAKLHSFFFKI